jgi:lipopolysaccharide/colanic/teichoic acid biosynthesis glycosyltransferase
MIYQVVKRPVDFLLTLLGLIVLLPLAAAIALAIKLTSPGPVIFRQNRVGKNGKVFTLYKFRTMRTDTDPYGFSPKDDSDPRVTSVGRVLRKYSLDELPQLVNVLKGDMALVGPRPLLPWQYEQWTDRQKRRCRVKPGLTGWAQVQGRGAVAHEDKIELDLWYVDHAGPWLDLAILARTVGKVFRAEDTLEVTYSRKDPPRPQSP